MTEIHSRFKVDHFEQIVTLVLGLIGHKAIRVYLFLEVTLNYAFPGEGHWVGTSWVTEWPFG